jgi:hypothetical protein
MIRLTTLSLEDVDDRVEAVPDGADEHAAITALASTTATAGAPASRLKSVLGMWATQWGSVRHHRAAQPPGQQQTRHDEEPADQALAHEGNTGDRGGCAGYD